MELYALELLNFEFQLALWEKELRLLAPGGWWRRSK